METITADIESGAVAPVEALLARTHLIPHLSRRSIVILLF